MMSSLLLVVSFASLVYYFCLLIKLGIKILPIFSTFQKPYCEFCCNTEMANASDAMKPERFSGQNFRRRQTRAMFWLMSLGLWWVIHPQYPFTIEQYMQFEAANNTALGCILTVLADQLYDVYMDYKSATELWDALEH